MSLAAALRLRARCDYAGALDALADARSPDELVARSRLYEELGRYEEARVDAERSGDRARIAGVAVADRRYAEAVELAAGLTCVERGRALELLARLDEADAVYRSLPDDDVEVRLGRGGVLRARGAYADAERELFEALRLAEEQLGEWSIETASVLNALGMTYKYWGRFDDGRHVYERALAIVERAFGEMHEDVATLHHNLGGLEHARREFQAAEPHARRSVELRRVLRGPEDVTTAEDEAAWAPILKALGHVDEAQALLRHALPILEGELGPQHPEVAGAWNNLAGTLADPEEAAAAYRRALDIKEHTLGPEHPSLAITLNNLGVNARRRGRAEEAESYYRRALEILERRVEADHPTLELTRRNLERLAAGKTEDAPRV